MRRKVIIPAILGSDIQWSSHFYHVKMGEEYVYFDDDGNVIKNSRAGLPYMYKGIPAIHIDDLENLPFDVVKANESGIIQLEKINKELAYIESEFS